MENKTPNDKTVPIIFSTLQFPFLFGGALLACIHCRR